MTPNLTDVDHPNLSDGAAKFLLGGNFPPFPDIPGLNWLPPSQTPPVVRGTNPGRIKIFCDADSHDWTEYMNDIPGGDNAAAGQVQSYWDGQPPANYVATLRSYWALVPGSYTQVTPTNTFQKSYTATYGISQTDAQSIAASLGVEVEGLSASITAEFSQSVTTSSETSETTTYTVPGPAEGLTTVWMLWQLVDELCMIDPATGTIMANRNRRANVNWSDHNASGAYTWYNDFDQHFPSSTLIPLTKNFPSA